MKVLNFQLFSEFFCSYGETTHTSIYSNCLLKFYSILSAEISQSNSVIPAFENNQVNRRKCNNFVKI